MTSPTSPSFTVQSPVGAAFVVLVGTLAAVSAMSQFYRNTVGVIATTLTAELGVTADQLGLLSASFFLVFALCQIPVGIVIDRYGPRAAILGSTAFVVAGSILFGLATDFATLLTARILLGIGCSTFLMAPLVIYARAFRPEAFAGLTGLQVSLASIGTLGATAPLAMATETFGWRPAFVATGLLTGAVAVLVMVVVRGPVLDQRSTVVEPFSATLRGVGRATRVQGFWPLFLMQFATYSTFALMVGLWGGPYLAHIHGASLTGQGQVLLAMAVMQVVGVLVLGSADRWVGAYKPIVFVAGAVTVVLLALTALVGHGLGFLGAGVLFALIGFACGFTPVLMAHGKSLFPPELTGRGITLLNIGTMGGGFAMQVITGAAVRAIAGTAEVYPVGAFQTAFLLQAVVLVIALVVYRRAPDPRRALAG